MRNVLDDLETLCADLDAFSPSRVRRRASLAESVSGLVAMTDDVTSRSSSGSSHGAAAMTETTGDYVQSRLISAGELASRCVTSSERVMTSSERARRVGRRSRDRYNV